MRYKILGKTKLNVSILGLGGIPLQRINSSEAERLIDYLIDSGINFADTARAYSNSEELIGNAIKQKRSKLILASKSMARSYNDMAKDIDLSLKNLKTDYIDLYQLHNVRFDTDFDVAFADNGAVKAIQDAIKSGKVLHMGASAHTQSAFSKLLDYNEIESVMFPFNLAEQQGLTEMKRAFTQNVGFIAMKPLAGGNIVNGRLALRYVLSNELCSVAIPGMANIEEAKANIDGALDSSPLCNAELNEIEALIASLKGSFCRRCGYCAPCTKGIDIPAIFILEGYLKRYDLAAWARARYEAVAVKPQECIECGQCEQRCPYALPIIQMLKTVAKSF